MTNDATPSPPAVRADRLRPWHAVVAALAFALAVQTAVVVGKFAGHPTGLFRVGQPATTPEARAWLGFAPYAHPSGGSYDGQYFLFLAYDPLLRHGVGRFLDVPAWRARRIGYPLAAWAVALGVRPCVPFALYAINLAATAGCVALLARRLCRAGLTPAWGAGFVLLACSFMTLTTLTCEGVATCALLLACLGHERGRPRAALAATLAAVLVKEVALLWVAALALAALLRRRGGLAVGCAAVAGAWFLWGAYADARLAPQPRGGARESVRAAVAPSAAAGSSARGRLTIVDGGDALAYRARYFTWPLAGAAGRLRLGWGDGSGSSAARVARQVTEAGLMLTLLALAAHGLATLRRREAWLDPSALLYAACGAAALCLSAAAWSWSGNFARQLYLLPAIALWRLPAAGRWGHAALAAHIACGALRLAAVALNA